jgi:ATP-dependent helicase/nuclease subunit A
MKWTSDQLKAIEMREKNMLVSAAAGSGKTALLIERIIRIIINEEANVNELLVLTFTRGAAGEMRNRLRVAITKELEDPNNNRPYLLKQMSLLGSANISTFHSFCLSVIRQYFQKVEIDPGFKVGNDTEITLMRKETLEEVFENEYLESENQINHPFIQLIEKYSGNRNDQNLKDSIEKFYHFWATQPEPEGWCEKSLNLFGSDCNTFWESLWGIGLLDLLKTELTGAKDCLKKAENASCDVIGFEKTHQQLTEDCDHIEALSHVLKEDHLKGIEMLGEMSFPRYKGNKKADESLNETIKESRNNAKEIVQSLQKQFVAGMDTMIDELNELEETMFYFVELTKKFMAAFQVKKGKKNLVDYNDLEQLTLKILKDPLVAKEIQKKYKYVFLDEYQDTNEMQETILQQVVRDNNYFMVGDVKQSIYRFRLADPTIFLNKYDAFSNGLNEQNELVILSKNFRSAQGVIDGINEIFRKIMSPKLGEINYDARAILNKGLTNQGKYEKVEIHLLPGKDQKNEFMNDDELKDDPTTIEMEANFVGKKIQSLVGTPFFDTRKNQERLIEYNDFGILMRSVQDSGDVYQKVFNDLGIPAYFEGGYNYYESLEISIIINLLNLIDNQHQDLPLLSIMTSPIGGFTTTDCTGIRIEYPEGFYYQGVESYRYEKEDLLSKKINAFYNKIIRWQDDSKIMPIEDFLWKVYMESGYYSFVGALPGGEQRQCNLRMLLKRAGDYKKSTLRGLFQYIRFIENMKKHKEDISPPGVLSSGDSVVRIMTIHKSKGLEFPIVFLTSTGKQFNKRGNYDQILFHKDLGICPDYVNLEKRYKRSSLSKEVCKYQNNREMLSEEMRLLYVAMTRAEEKLVIVGTVNKLEQRIKQWLEDSNDYRLLKAKGSLDWIMQGAIGGKGRSELKAIESFDSFKIVRHDMKNEFDQETQDLNNNEKKKIQEIKKESNDELNKQIKNDHNDEKRKAIFSRLACDYCRSEDDQIPNKMSVTDIKKIQSHDNKTTSEMQMATIQSRFDGPGFLKEKAHDFSATQKGSALHLFMETVDFDPMQKQLKANGNAGFNEFLKGYLKKELERLMRDDYLLEGLAQTIELSKIGDFFGSSLGQRLLSSQKIMREMPFNYGYDPQRIKPEWKNATQMIMVQGIIDSAFIEEKQWVLIDYKTDFYKNKNQRDALIKQYAVQLNLYEEALFSLTQIPVKEKIIVFIRMKENIVLNKV